MTHSVDVLVGQRMRQRRSLLGMTTQQLGDLIGTTCQQVQEYEAGEDRVGSNLIWDIAEAMEVPVMFFFEGLDGQPNNAGEVCGGIFTAKEMLDLGRV